jgi:hypothetical protein
MILVDVQIEGNLEQDGNRIKNNIREDLHLAVKAMGSSTLKKAEELAQQHLSPKLASMYRTALKIEQLSEDVVIIELDQKALWIEKGRKAGFMEDLLKSGTKKAKDGSKYRVIPIGESKTSPQSPSVGENLVPEIKSFLQKKGIRTGAGDLELDSRGSPRLGKINTFNIKDLKDKKQISDNISRISVFQNKNPKTGKVEKSITAFRVISEKHKGTGKWVHPGTPPAEILEKAFKWSEQLWQTELFLAIKAKYEGK